MADNITEADHLIIQLLAALNSTIGSYTASQESDNTDATANQLALTALIVSLIALVVALLQAVLEYVSSNSAQGEKCNAGAIGEYSRVSGTRRWSWRHWRRQYFYPELDLDLFNVGANIHDVNDSEVSNVFKGFSDLRPARLDNFESMGYYSWRYDRYLEYTEMLQKNSIRNGIHHLFRRDEAGWALVSSQNLPLNQWLKWTLYLAFHRHREEISPRATWVQLLALLNVDTRRIGTGCLVGADCIPSTLDVPAQKVKITDLGIFAFCLGFNKVEISAKDRTILAAGEMGSITTESLPGFGAVVRFQILSPRPKHFVAVHKSKDALVYHRCQLLGSFILDWDFPEIEDALPIRYNWLRSHLDPNRTALDPRCPTIAHKAEAWVEITESLLKYAKDHGQEVLISSETALFSRCLWDWQARQHNGSAGGTGRWPTILLAASTACLPEITTGFPSSALLHPFLEVFQYMSHSLSSPPVATWDNLDDLNERTMILQLLHCDICRIPGHESMIDENKWGRSSWLFNKLGPLDLERIEKILLGEMTTDYLSDFNSDGLKIRLSWVREGSIGYVRPNKTTHSKPQNTSDSRSCSRSLLDGWILPYTVELLASFDPRSWAKAMRSRTRPEGELGRLQVVKLGEKGRRSHVQPQNVLWAQIFLLDLAICNILHQYVEIELNASKAVAKALVDCWEDPTADAPLESLDKILSKTLLSDQGTQDQVKQMSRLAYMIKVRTLCYIAYMMVIPDSTSLYEASSKDPVLLPMI